MMRYCMVVLFSLLLNSITLAQPIPRLTVITPAGGQAGTTVQVTLTGVDLETTTSLMIAPAGLTAEKVPNPAKAGEFLPNQFAIKIPKDMQPATFDMRAVGSNGVTNPRAFVVGELPEVQEKEPNNDVPQAQQLPMNTTVNGTISAPSDVDYFSITCKKDETVLVQVAAESIDSRLEPDIRIYNTAGRLMAANRPRAEPDGFCQFTATAAGTYYVRLCAHAHVEGNVESFYRLSVSTRPWIESVYPSVVEPGKAAAVTVWGRNLVGATVDPLFKVDKKPLQKLAVTLAPPSEMNATQQLTGYQWIAPARAGMDGYFYRTRNPQGWSNSIPISYAQAPVVLENGDHGTAAKAQPVTLPCEIVGSISKPNDRDWYSFTAKKDEVLSFEGFAERIGTPIDMYFEVRYDNGKLIGEFDEHPEQSVYHRFFARTDDPAARVTMPADGKYLLMVSSRDASARGDLRLQYRVSVHKPRPDFRVVAVDANPLNPGALRLVPGGRQHLDLILFRKEGFTGPVTLTVEGLPAGVTCQPQNVPNGATNGSLVLTATDKAAEFTGNLIIKATATIDGQTVTREARAGCLIWPNANELTNGPGISRLCRTLPLAVRPGTPSMRLSVQGETLAIPAGGNQAIKVKLERLWPEAKVPVVITAVHLPPGVTFNNNQPLTIAADKNDAEVRLVLTGGNPADQFPLVLRAVAPIPFNRDPKAKKAPVQMAETSSITRVTAYRQVVELATTPATLDLKPGGEATCTLKLTRLHGYQGTLSVQMQNLPAGVTAAAVTVPEKANEAKIVFKANKNAAAAKGAAVTLKCTGSVTGINLATETKVTINVMK